MGLVLLLTLTVVRNNHEVLFADGCASPCVTIAHSISTFALSVVVILDDIALAFVPTNDPNDGALS